MLREHDTGLTYHFNIQKYPCTIFNKILLLLLIKYAWLHYLLLKSKIHFYLAILLLLGSGSQPFLVCGTLSTKK